MQTIGALYRDFRSAEQAVDDLVRQGYSRDLISLVGNNVSGDYNDYLNPATEEDAVDPAKGAAFGAVSGGVIGALVGLGALAIPGIGPVIAAGPIIAALTGGAIGAAAGAPTGGLVAGLIHSNYVNPDDAELYAEGVRRGQTLVTVQADDMKVSDALGILNKYNPTDVSGESQTWRTSGWDRFNPEAAPLTADEIRAYRGSPPIGATGALPDLTGMSNAAYPDNDDTDTLPTADTYADKNTR